MGKDKMPSLYLELPVAPKITLVEYNGRIITQRSLIRSPKKIQETCSPKTLGVSSLTLQHDVVQYTSPANKFSAIVAEAFFKHNLWPRYTHQSSAEKSTKN